MSSRRPFDRWFRYPAGFSPQTLTAVLDAVNVHSEALIADPFAGSASAGSQIVERGASYVGIEAHPLIAELAALKFARPGEPQGLIEAAHALANAAEPASTDAEAVLVRRCFGEETLSLLAGLRRSVEHDEGPWSTHLKWALLGTLRDVASVKVGWPYQRPSIKREAPHTDVRGRFIARAEMMACDLADAPETPGSNVVAGDSTTAAAWRDAMQGRQATACVTSPPYLNNFDYADATRLEAYFWGYASTWRELCTRVRSGMLIATTQQTRIALAEDAESQLKTYPRLCSEVVMLVEKLSRERQRRDRGKEYDRVLAPYFLGIARVLSRMHEHLTPNAVCAWLIGDSAPYGIYIDTPALVACLAEELGYKTGTDLPLRERGQRWRTNGTRHQVALSERLVTFARPAPRGGQRV